VADLESRPAAVRAVLVKARLAAAGFGHGAAAAAVAAVVVTAAPAAAVGLAGQPAAQSAVMAVLLCLLLAVTGQFIRLGRESQDRTRLLLAQLQDAREAEGAAAALAERSRIAGELHEVLAHSLSGLAIQLQGVRKLAGREAVSEALRAAIDRSAELAKAGLTDARQAVSALRGEQLPALAQLDALVEDRAQAVRYACQHGLATPVQ
jgi:signal transduction histidine kinase